MSSSIPSPSASYSSSAMSQPPQYRVIGVLLAVGSGVLIGSSFVFKKKGLLSSQKGHIAGEGVAYLKSPMWWTGMVLMILGELCNFAAYAFVEAIIVTPLGALSVVISSLLSHFILKEKLSLFGWIASVQCLLGACILALNGPEEQSVTTIDAFKHLFVTPWFLSYGGVIIVSAAFLAVWVAPRYGRKSMLPYIGVCSLIGGLSVSCTQGLGACILTSIRGENQFKNWFIYFLLVFVVITLLTEIYYLNVALALYNTAMVTPTYYVTFTFCTLVTSIILYKGLKASATQIMTVVLAFAVICTGIFVLQMSKVDPRRLKNVDGRTLILLEAARQEVDPYATRELERVETLRSRTSRCSRTSNVPHAASPAHYAGSEIGSVMEIDPEEEKRAIVERTEEPGLDALRGTFGALGTLIRARRRARAMSAASRGVSLRSGTRSVGSVYLDDAGCGDAGARRKGDVSVEVDVEKGMLQREDGGVLRRFPMQVDGAQLPGPFSSTSRVPRRSSESGNFAMTRRADSNASPARFVDTHRMATPSEEVLVRLPSRTSFESLDVSGASGTMDHAKHSIV